MPRFFFHLRDGTDEVLDPDGIDMSVKQLPVRLYMRPATVSPQMSAMGGST